MKAEMDAFKSHILKTAEDMVVNKFPNRIVMLNKMLGSGKLTRDPSSVFQKINIPVPDVSELAPSANVSAKSNTGTTTSQHSQPSDDQSKPNGETEVSIIDAHHLSIALSNLPHVLND